MDRENVYVTIECVRSNNLYGMVYLLSLLHNPSFLMQESNRTLRRDFRYYHTI